MQVVVVADKKRETVAENLVKAIATAKEPRVGDGPGGTPGSRPWSAEFWTEAKYRDTDAAVLGNKVVVVFVGPSQPAKDLALDLPARCAGLGRGAACPPSRRPSPDRRSPTCSSGSADGRWPCAH